MLITFYILHTILKRINIQLFMLLIILFGVYLFMVNLEFSVALMLLFITICEIVFFFHKQNLINIFKINSTSLCKIKEKVRLYV